jgi:hypothetical protein
MSCQPSALFVRLSSCGNPDFGQNPACPVGNALPRTQPVASLADASATCRRYIEHHQLGGGNWTGGLVLDGESRIVARVSYNGRVWSPDDETCLYSPH